MAYPGRQNIYEATIRRMVQGALEEQELQFCRAHESDPDEALLCLLRTWARENGHTPWPGELAGGSYLAQRFGSWERLIALAGLTMPVHPNNPQSFRRTRETAELQRELYRRKKAEKKQLAKKRLAQQAAKRKTHENR